MLKVEKYIKKGENAVMANMLGNKTGAIVLETDKGLLQIYIKDGKSIVTLESSRNLVTYAKSFEMKNVISPFASLIASILPNNLGLKVIGHEFGKRDNIIIEDNNEKLMLHNEGIKRGDKTVSFTTYNNIKIDNLFDEYNRNPNVFSGFCNYKIDSIGNIDNREVDLLKRQFKPKYTIAKFDTEKTHDALMKESSTERYLQKIYKLFFKEHESELDDIQRIGFKKIKNLFKEVSESLSDGKLEDMIDTLERAKTTIVARNSAIPNILTYINDSRIEGNYDAEEVNKALGMIYIKEKLHLFGKKSVFEDKFKGYELDPKLEAILCEDIVASYKKEERVNFEDLLPIQFVRARAKIMEISPEEETKIDGILKRYVDLLESVDYVPSSDSSPQQDRDELGVIIRNYENYLEEGVLSSLGMPSGDGFVTTFRNTIKKEIIQSKVNCDSVITFSYEEEGNEEVTKTSEYNYVIKGNTINVFKNNIDSGTLDVDETKSKYERYLDANEVKKQSLARLANKTHFIFVPEEQGVANIDQKYQVETLVNDTIYMLKTCDSEKDIKRTSYLNEISTFLGENTAAVSKVDIEDAINDRPPEEVLTALNDKIASSGYEDVEILSNENLEEISKVNTESSKSNLDAEDETVLD